MVVFAAGRPTCLTWLRLDRSCPQFPSCVTQLLGAERFDHFEIGRANRRGHTRIEADQHANGDGQNNPGQRGRRDLEPGQQGTGGDSGRV